ncbi:MAG: hypothetical protein GDA50_08940 [Alphaproteobacteria bacterium GM202ARS2]|nr:hypothetical protein [Alphaproteobacteria bacterium GM202ARS2]
MQDDGKWWKKIRQLMQRVVRLTLVCSGNKKGRDERWACLQRNRAI